MSKKQTTSQGSDQAPDLSALDFGPAWARNEPKKKHSRPHGDAESRGQRSGQSAQKRNSRDGFKGKDKRRQNFRPRERKPYQAPVAPPEGVSARIMPLEEGMDAMAKEISSTGRTHSVFDLAWLVLGGYERFHVIFDNEKGELFRAKSDQSLWLSQAECMSHFWSAELWKAYYDEEIIEVEAPSGNFASVARCSMSRQLIAPPNHHSYQQKVLDIHRAQFSHISLDQYKSKIVVEQTEEAVNEWIEVMKKSSQWKSKAVEGEDSAESFTTRRDLEAHFLANGFSEEFEKGKSLSVLGNIGAQKISPGLFSLLKSTVAEEKRYPGKLASILCRQMSGRHLAVYKWKKRLHCGPARPKNMPEGVVMADRPAALYKWVAENPSGNLDAMWKHCLPADVDDETKHAWYHDLHWLINEGQVLLLSDGTLHPAKTQVVQNKQAKIVDKSEEPKSDIKQDPESGT